MRKPTIAALTLVTVLSIAATSPAFAGKTFVNVSVGLGLPIFYAPVPVVPVYQPAYRPGYVYGYAPGNRYGQRGKNYRKGYRQGYRQGYRDGSWNDNRPRRYANHRRGNHGNGYGQHNGRRGGSNYQRSYANQPRNYGRSSYGEVAVTYRGGYYD